MARNAAQDKRNSGLSLPVRETSPNSSNHRRQFEYVRSSLILERPHVLRLIRRAMPTATGAHAVRMDRTA